MMKKVLLSSVVLASVGGAYVYSASSNVHSPIYPRLIIPILHSIDAEQAHNLSIKVASLGLTPKLHKSLIDSDSDRDMLRVRVLNREFQNPIGLAAGYDKNAQCMKAMNDIGFGFMEVGSICPKPQDGNPKPRIFRAKLNGDESSSFDTIINRCGFNSHGMDLAEERLSKYRQSADNDSNFPIGVNIGKNKVSPVESVDDYVTGLNRLSKYADFLVVNVSSPNTPHLRSLQNRDPMAKLLTEVKLFKKDHSDKKVLIKIAPDLTDEQKIDVAQLALEYNIDGIIVSNTTIDRPDASLFTPETRNVLEETGGLSGKPVFNKSTQVLKEMYKLTNGQIVLIGVGGVTSGRDALEKIESGASLVQIYTGFTAKGPAIVDQINAELVQELKQKGYKHVSEAVGRGVVNE